jgi:hypothetical protein
MALIVLMLMVFLSIGLFAREHDRRTSVLMLVAITSAILLFYRVG